MYKKTFIIKILSNITYCTTKLFQVVNKNRNKIHKSEKYESTMDM